MTKKILIIDDSALMRRVISDIINENHEYEVVAIAKDGLEGFDRIVSNPMMYSAIILDINMPKMNGLELLQKLQKNHIEQTVIVVSTVAKQGAKETIQALEYGAFDFVTKPENYLETKSDEFKKTLYNMLNVATSSKASVDRAKAFQRTSTQPNAKPSVTSTRSSVIPRTPDRTSTTSSTSAAEAIADLRRKSASNTETEKIKNVDSFRGISKGKNKIIALACSTGGPKSLQQVIPYLPKNLDAGVVIVQHMPKGFTLSLAQRLNEMSELTVSEARDGEVISKGKVLIAPGGRHLRIAKSGSDYVVKLGDDPAIEGLRPCANLMYESLEKCNYDENICVVLTGMGADGTKGIKGLAQQNKKIHVIAQDEDSSVVYGMPKAIAQSGLVNEVVPLNKVAETIIKNVGVS